MRLMCTYLIYIILCGFLNACNSPERPNVQKTKPTNLPRAVSSTYQPAVFKKDQRVSKIKGIAPDLQKLIEEHAKENNIPGIAYGIVVDNALVVTGATGLINRENKLPATIQSGFRIASMSKSFTAMAIMKLRDEGKLSLSDLAEKYVPEMAGLTYLTSDAPTITIENLLTMTAGFPEDNPWGDRQLDEPADMIVDLIKEGIAFSNVPSYGYEYSNTGYAILGYIITKVSGKTYQQYISDNILKPLAMDHTYWEFDSVPKDQLAIGYRWEDEQWKLEPMLHDGCYGAMAGLITTIEDFGKYVSFHLAAWPPKSEKDNGLVKRSTLRAMHTPQFSRLKHHAKDYNGEPCVLMAGYAYGLATLEDCKGLKMVRHGGALPGFGSDYRFYPDYGVGIMAFGNLTYTNPLPHGKMEKLLFQLANLEPRTLPVSNILAERKAQVVQLIKEWDDNLASEIVGENFLLDHSKDHRIAKIKEELGKAGVIKSIGDLEPQNQLRGTYIMQGEKGQVKVKFTLTPEKSAKLQYLSLTFEPGEGK